MGLAMTMKKQNNITEALWFSRLACFIEPYNIKTWEQYI